LEQTSNYVVRRFTRAMIGLAAVTLVGTACYMWIEGWGFIDALYMTAITLSTVGFGEVAELSPLGRLFTIALIVVGVGWALYLLAVLAEMVLEGRIRDLLRREQMVRHIRGMSDHVILAGYGRFGRAVAGELDLEHRAYVVLDVNPELEDELSRTNIPFVIGSASLDEDLDRAGIAGASCVVAATPSEAENVFITLAARELNPTVRIHARAETEAGSRRLRRAGADLVTAPFQMGGSRVAASIIRPAVVDFLQLVSPTGESSIGMEEVAVQPGSAFIGMSALEVEGRAPGARIVGLRSRGASMQPLPMPETEIAEGDMVVVIGSNEDLATIAELAGEGT
jgi:voltage-gated potassium channel